MQSVELKLKGLFSNYNNLSDAPKGSLVVGENIVIDRDSVIEPRRGLVSLIYRLPSSTARTSNILNYQNYILNHYGPANIPDTLAYYDNVPATKTSLVFNSGTNTIAMVDTSGLSIGQTVLATEISNITCIADVGGNLNNKYFLINNADDTAEYYVWYNVSGAGVNPFLPGKVGIAVAITTGSSSIAVASATSLAINAISDFSASVLGNIVTVIRAAAGVSFPAHDSVPSPTGFSFSNIGSGVPINTYITSIITNTSIDISNNLNLNRTLVTANFVGWRNFDGTYLVPDSNLGRIRGALANQNLYFTSNTGVKRLDTITGQPVASGGIKALETFASLTDISGFMANNTKVAYRVVWGYKDSNNNLILGAPSQRTVLANTNGYSCNVQHVISIPDGITEDHFYQLYRSALTISSEVEPNDELYLVMENNPTGAEILAKSLTVIDTTPEELTGATLYTSSSQEGIAQANDAPPFAKDIATFRNSLFFANTRSKHRLTLTLLGVSGEFDITGDTFHTGTIKNTAYNLKITKIGTITNGSNIITGLANIEPLVLGQGIFGNGIPADTVIASFNSSTSLNMSQNATASGAVTLSFSLVGVTIGQLISGTGIPVSTQVLDVFDPILSTGDTTTSGSNLITNIPSTAQFKVGQPILATGGVIPANTFITSINNSTSIFISNNLLAALPEITNITCPAGNTASLNNSYFTINSALDTIQYYVWFNVDGTGVDPAPAGLTPIPVAVLSIDTDAQVAAKVDTAISAVVASFGATTLGNVVTVTNVNTGITTDAANFNVPSLTISVTQQGRGGNVNDTLILGNGLRLSQDATATNAGITLTLKNGTSGFQVDDTITIAGTTYTAKKQESISAGQFKLYAQGTPAQNIDDSVRSLIRVINRSTVNTNVYAYYISEGQSYSQSISNLLPGKFLIEERGIGGAAFSAVASANGTSFNPTLPISGTSVSSTNDEFRNGLYFSKSSQPEAVPVLNYIFVGSADQEIYRILALRDALFVFKSDGIYRLTGTDPATFRVDLLDNTAILLAPESAKQLNNQIFAYTSQGVVAVSDTGVSVMSRPIENQLLNLQSILADTIKKKAYAVAYETDRKYVLLMPATLGDTENQVAYVYNTFTEAWTRWLTPFSCGLVNTNDDKLYFGSSVNNRISVERKNRDYTDYADDVNDFEILNKTGTTILLNSVLGVSVGDILFQVGLPASLVTSVNQAASTITISDNIDFIVGPVQILSAINSIIEFVPQIGGNPGILKHFREVSLFFKESQFRNLYLNFNTELSTLPEPITFNSYGSLQWGLFNWGKYPWGGITSAINVRTYVPKTKQKCTQLSLNINHREAYSHYSLQGISLVYNPISERITR